MPTGTGGLVGTVRDADGGAAAGALVVATDQRCQVVAATATDVDGGYRIDDLVLGSFSVTISASDHRPAAEPALVSVEGTRRDIKRRREGSVQGTVRGRDGRPLEDAQVTLLDAIGNVVAVYSTGAEGTYSFTDLSDESYTMIASGYPPMATTFALNRSSQKHLDLVLGPRALDHGGPEAPPR